MGLFAMVENMGSKMKWYDFSVFKGSVISAMLLIMVLWDGLAELLLSLAWYWYLIAFIAFSIPLFKKMFSD